MMNNLSTTKLAKNFNTENFNLGASYLKLMSWYIINLLVFKSGLIPFSNVLVWFLRLFGSTIGQDVRIKPHIQIKYPWKLIVGDYSWLGNCTIENLDQVTIGSHVCISQGASLLTGNHNYNHQNFNLITNPIVIENGVWIAANSTVCPGVVAKSHSVLCVGSIANKDLEAYSIYKGNPALFFKNRLIN
jgi:putative colanic acid biosynthesis acetyltransferase WcaF